MGGFTRLLHSGAPDDLMDEVPTFLAAPLPNSVVEHSTYPVLNRPYAFLQWIRAANISEEYVLMSEPDHILLRPLPNLMRKDAWPAAYPFFYIEPARVRAAVWSCRQAASACVCVCGGLPGRYVYGHCSQPHHHPLRPPPPATHPKHTPSQDDYIPIVAQFLPSKTLTKEEAEDIAQMGNSPTFMSMEHMRKVVPLWQQLSVDIFSNRVANEVCCVCCVGRLARSGRVLRSGEPHCKQPSVPCLTRARAPRRALCCACSGGAGCRRCTHLPSRHTS
jgi:hypothetical protein